MERGNPVSLLGNQGSGSQEKPMVVQVWEVGKSERLAVHVPKKSSGAYRPLSIPPMKCRGMQALHLLAFEPVVETIADKNSYGFRPKRSTADAIEQCFKTLSRRSSVPYILEGDIRACFDTISHRWLQDNVTMDKELLRKWLKAGYIEKKTFHPTERGTSQGSIISPALLNATLSGLEATVQAAATPKDKVHISVYCDDFIITGATKEILEEKIKPVVKAFLYERGLELSEEKTKLMHIKDGFNFLGFNIRKYGDKLLIKPSKESIKRFRTNIKEAIKKNKTAKTENLIYLLNPKVRGWTNYFRHGVSKATFSHVDSYIFESLWRWAVRRHPNKNKAWTKDKYFRTQGFRHWVFHAKVSTKDEKSINLDLMKSADVVIKRHGEYSTKCVKFRGEDMLEEL
jgi:RNA-directed DNA polymerase